MATFVEKKIFNQKKMVESLDSYSGCESKAASADEEEIQSEVADDSQLFLNNVSVRNSQKK